MFRMEKLDVFLHIVGWSSFVIANLADAEILGMLRVHAPHVHPQQIGPGATILAHVASEDHWRFIFGFRFLIRLRSADEELLKVM